MANVTAKTSSNIFYKARCEAATHNEQLSSREGAADYVVVIAATNRLDILDKAFVSRCSQKYEMPPFTVEESKQMVNKFLNDIEISIPDIEIDQVVQKNSDQRTIMADVIRLIADRLEVEDENS